MCECHLRLLMTEIQISLELVIPLSSLLLVCFNTKVQERLILSSVTWRKQPLNVQHVGKTLKTSVIFHLPRNMHDKRNLSKKIPARSLRCGLVFFLIQKRWNQTEFLEHLWRPWTFKTSCRLPDGFTLFGIRVLASMSPLMGNTLLRDRKRWYY